jgi:hypothetical protein
VSRRLAALCCRCRHAITRVSRRWHRVFYEEASLWRTVQGHPPKDALWHSGSSRADYHAVHAAILSRVAAFVEEASFDMRAMRSKQPLLSLLQPGKLRSLPYRTLRSRQSQPPCTAAHS